jgi:hypothetical protein
MPVMMERKDDYGVEMQEEKRKQMLVAKHIY